MNPLRKRRPAAPRLLAVVTSVLLVVGIGAAAPALAASKPVLVGMGDSYTSGLQVVPRDPSAVWCTRSLAAYPLVTAGQLGYAGRSAACAGAVLADLTHKDRRGAPPQISGIGDADYVAMTIGGNDVGGPYAIIDAGASAAGATAFAADVDALQPQLAAAFADVKAAASARAVVFVLGYPDILPRTQQATNTCLGALSGPLNAADMHSSVRLLNDAMASAARSAGAVYVDTSASFAGHEMCTSRPYANLLEARPQYSGAAMHPNEMGHQVLAADLAAAIASR